MTGPGGGENRNMQVARIFQVLAILQSSRKGRTVAEIENALIDRGFEVQKRTVYRDIDALETAGFPVVRDEGSPQRIRVEDEARINGYLVLSPREILALYLAEGALQPLANTPFHDDLKGLFAKIDDKLGTGSREHLREIRDGFKFDPGPRWGLGMDPDVIDTLRAACAERHVLTGVYASASSNTTRERRIGPHYLYFAKGSLYLVGEDLEDSKIKVFSAPRFKSIAMTDEAYTGAVSTPEEYFQGAFGLYKDASTPVDVSIQFSKQIAPYVSERKWHASQAVIKKEDGSIIMNLHCQANLELVRWILGFGSNARVIAPKELIDAVREESRQVAKIYK
jgi:proteasome accessory factor B